MGFTEHIGVVGFIGYIVSYVLLQTGSINGNGVIYIVLNLLSAICVLISLTVKFNLASMLIQSCWIVISLWGLYRIVAKLITDRSEITSLEPACAERSPEGERDLMHHYKREEHERKIAENINFCLRLYGNNHYRRYRAP